MIRESCGVFGVYGHPDAVRLTYLGLYALQHRGQESAGIVSRVGGSLVVHKGMGLVGEVFTSKILDDLRSDVAIGHVRYSTTGSSIPKNAQPLLIDYVRGQIAVAHNGNLVNAYQLHKQLEETGSIFQTTTDSEILIHLIARYNKRRFEDALRFALNWLKGAFSFVILTEDQLIGVRDPNGFRPLCLGQLENAYILSSESCALDLIGADYIREIEPGEMVMIDGYGLRSIKYAEEVNEKFCVFEYIYFARPDSRILGESVHEVRERLGMKLAEEHPVQADIVIPVPDSGNAAALGYSMYSKIPFELGITRNHYIGRTFIQPSEYIRDFRVKIKLNPIKSVLEGKRIVLVDDSIVRGTTSRSRIRTIREAGTKEIHMRISCPPHRFPCVYGIDFPKQSELIAASKSVEQIAEFLKVDSLGYLSIKGMLNSIGIAPERLCYACFSGKYPVTFEEGDKFKIERRRK